MDTPLGDLRAEGKSARSVGEKAEVEGGGGFERRSETGTGMG